MKRAGFAFAIFAVLVSFTTAGKSNRSSELLTIDLASALRLAGARNLDVQLAKEKFAEARAAEESAIERFFPWVVPGVTYRRHDNLIQNTEGVIEDVHKQSYAPGGTIAAQTDIGDAIFKSLEAHQLMKAARHGLDAQRQETILAAALAYFDLAAAHEAVGVARDALRASTDYAAEIERAVNAGIAFKGDALRVKVQQQRDKIALRRAEENARLASAKLVQILHLDPTIELMPRDASVVPLSLVSTKESLGDLVSQALAARPETQQSAALLSAAQHAKNGAIYGPLVPTVGGQAFFGGLGGGMNSETGHFGESEDYVALLTWRVGPGGLFDLGNIHARQAHLRGAALTADKVIDQIANEVIASQTRLQSLAAQIAIAKESLSDAEEALRLGQERKEFGVGVVLEMIQAEQDRAHVRNDYLNIVTDYNKTQYTLLRAVGRLSASPPTSAAIGDLK
ncbi:MAG: TolC family protein [Chthoniobacterales bacterium]|nr:TolC family protein [Chthoniobacterales bacterium]